MRLRRVVGVAVAGVAALWLVAAGGVLLAPYILAQFVALVTAVASGFTWLVQALAEGQGFWEVGMTAIRTIGSAMSSPGFVGAIVGVELLGLAALYGLDRMLSAEPQSGETVKADDRPDQGTEQE